MMADIIQEQIDCSTAEEFSLPQLESPKLLHLLAKLDITHRLFIQATIALFRFAESNALGITNFASPAVLYLSTLTCKTRETHAKNR
jgi:hypothetical protein